MKEQWAKAVNNKDNLSKKDEVYGNKIPGEINAQHYMLYNIIRGLPIDRGFARKKNFKKIKESLYFNLKYFMKYGSTGKRVPFPFYPLELEDCKKYLEVIEND